MDIELPRAVRYLGIILMVVGLGISIFGMTLSYPDPSVTYVDEFDQGYAEENKQEGFRVPIVGGNDGDIPPEEVHRYYNSTQLSNETMDTLKEKIESDGSFAVDSMNETVEYRGRFIAEFEDGSQHVYEGEPDGIYPPKLFLYSIITSTIGFLVYSSMRGTEKSIPENVKISEVDDWDYDIKEE